VADGKVEIPKNAGVGGKVEIPIKPCNEVEISKSVARVFPAQPET
jgi:hypothetical protein